MLSLVAIVVLAAPPAYVKSTAAPTPADPIQAYEMRLRQVPRVEDTKRPTRPGCGTTDVHFEALAIGGGKFGPPQVQAVWDAEALDPCKIPPAKFDAKKFGAVVKIASDQVHPKSGDVLVPVGNWEPARDDQGNLAAFLIVRLYSKQAPIPSGDQCGNDDKSRRVICGLSGSSVARSYDVQKVRLDDATAKARSDKEGCRTEAWVAVVVNNNLLYRHADAVKKQQWESGLWYGTRDGIIDEETVFKRMAERGAAAQKLFLECGGSASEIPDKDTNANARDL